MAESTISPISNWTLACQQLTNARLLAAAPDLIQALKDWQNYDLTLEERQNRAMVAISKAERGQS